MIIVRPSFSKYFRPHHNEKPVLSNSSCLKSALEKLRFRDGLVWTEGLTGETKLRLQIPPASCGEGLQLRSLSTKTGLKNTSNMQRPIRAKCCFVDQSGVKLATWCTLLFPRLLRMMHCFFEFRLVYWTSSFVVIGQI